MRAWRRFLIVHSRVTRQLGDELEDEQHLALASYDVLLQLAEAPDGLRMSELADAVLLSRSGLTRLVDRLVRDALVERRSCPIDGRGTYAVLTPKGRDQLRSASSTHMRGVAEHFVNHYTPAELDTLAELLGRLLPPGPESQSTCGQDA
ncbi:MAG: MarR family winged helix-turn-helix transcriptional regulator [Frankia sp.]